MKTNHFLSVKTANTGAKCVKPLIYQYFQNFIHIVTSIILQEDAKGKKDKKGKKEKKKDKAKNKKGGKKGKKKDVRCSNCLLFYEHSAIL
jgi:hypothetical protein